jgi:hypothetical protein
MDSNKENPTSSSCGPECSCNTKRGMPLKIKIVLFIVIIAVAGAVLAGSLIKKARTSGAVKSANEFAVSASQLPASSGAARVSGAADTQTVSFKPISSLTDLNTVAQEVEAVFILLIKNEAEKTAGMLKEINAAKKAIASRGMRMGAFQLSREAPDYAAITGQMPAPCVLVVVKGKGMRGVPGGEITETKLLQAYLAAMQPTSCCPAGGSRVCK